MTVTQELLESVRARLSAIGRNPTGYQIAKALDVRQSTVTAWTGGKTGMSDALVLRACEWTYGGDPDMQRIQEYWLCRRREELAEDGEVAAVWRFMADQGARVAASSKYYVKYGRRWLRRLLVGLAPLAFAGCTALPAHEAAWQAAHMMDFAQTLNGPAGDPCFVEGDPLTRAVIGERPSQSDVAAFFVSTAIAHYFGSRWLDRTDFVSPGVKRALRTVDISLKVYVVADNHAEGIRPFGNNDPQHGFCAR